MSIENKKLIVVLGMHRSGTSAITRGLQVMGVDLGKQLPPAMSDNQKGFWEDADINSINIEMLATINSDWHHLVPIEKIDVETLIKKGFLLRAAVLLREKINNAPIFGFKDPRVAKLLPFWQKVFTHCQLDVSYVVALRHPLSVVSSLAARNHFDTVKSYLLWLGHVITCLTENVAYKRVFVDYDILLQSPNEELKRIAECLALEIAPLELKKYTEEFLEPALRHTVYDLSDLQADENCPHIVREIYSSLLAVASDQLKIDSPELQNNISTWFNEFNRMKPYLLLMDKLHKQGEVSNNTVINQSEQITEFNHALTNRDQQVTELNHALTNRDQQVTELNHALTNRDQQVTELNSVISTERSEIMPLSDWAHNMNTTPIRYGIKKYGLEVAKSIYRSLPINPSYKNKIKIKISPLLNSPKQKTSPSSQLTSPISTEETKLVHLSNSQLPSKRDIFVFSVIDWHFRVQRPQHLASSFAKAGHRVFFFSNHFIDNSTPGYELEQLDPQLDLYQIKLHVSGAPAIYFAPPTTEALSMIQKSLAKLILDFAAVSSVSVIQHAYWYPLVTRIANTIRIYDCMDHHEGFGNVPEKLIDIEKNMLSEADQIIVTSTWLQEFTQDYNNNVAVIRNAGEYEHFSKSPKQKYIDPKNRKIIGYFGAIAEWFDIGLIKAISIALPDALILLIGDDTINAQKTLKKLTNVQFIGEIPYSKLPYYLHSFDVCLLPFQVIPLTLATNPVKVYEYLAAGKPVVCVDLPEVAQFGDLVSCASTQDEFIRSVSEIISLPDNDSDIQLRKEFAREQTWDHRIVILEQEILNIPLPKISVIVLTYNNLDLTKACLDSILRWSDYPNIEIIIVDNASTDGSPDYLTAFQKKHPQIKLLLNENNLGFAAGNNVGLKAATGDYLVMLNNDTVVTPGWLLTMLRHLQADDTIGLIGPVTNNIGNEAKINIEYNNLKEMLPLAMQYTTNHMGRHFPIKTAAFFCVMLPRKVFEKVGLLDEDFGRGFFEDDDYCRRVEQLNLSVVCAEDVFIHHNLSASFDKLKQEDRQKLFNDNKKTYEKKWGEWVPHTYR